MNPVELRAFLTKFVPEVNNLLDSRIHKALLCDGNDAVHRALTEFKQAYLCLVERLEIEAHETE